MESHNYSSCQDGIENHMIIPNLTNDNVRILFVLYTNILESSIVCQVVSIWSDATVDSPVLNIFFILGCNGWWCCRKMFDFKGLQVVIDHKKGARERLRVASLPASVPKALVNSDGLSCLMVWFYYACPVKKKMFLDSTCVSVAIHWDTLSNKYDHIASLSSTSSSNHNSFSFFKYSVIYWPHCSKHNYNKIHFIGNGISNNIKKCICKGRGIGANGNDIGIVISNGIGMGMDMGLANVIPNNGIASNGIASNGIASYGTTNGTASVIATEIANIKSVQTNEAKWPLGCQVACENPLVLPRGSILMSMIRGYGICFHFHKVVEHGIMTRQYEW